MSHSLLYCGNGDVLGIVVHKNVRLSEFIVSDILNSDHLAFVFHLLVVLERGNVQTRLTNSQFGSGFKAWPLN
jgi:hypothetical protein